MRLKVNEVAVLSGAKEMIQADFKQIRGRGIGGDVAAEFRMFAIGAHHHRQRVPAHQRGDAFFEREVAGIGRLLGERYGVAIGRGGVEFEPAATAPRGVEQLLHDEFGACFAFNGNQ